MPTVSPPKPRTPTQAAKQNTPPVERSVKYDNLFCEVFGPDNPLTVEKAKELLGWESQSDYTTKMKAADPNSSDEQWDFGNTFMLKDIHHEKVRANNNIRNRPFVMGVALQYANDILKGYWKLNGEAIIIGRTGIVLSGQHRLAGLILADQKRVQASGGYDYWTGPCNIQTIVNYGVDESPETTRTIDNVEPRTLANVLFADTTLFGKLTDDARRKVTKIADWAVRTVWDRTGLKSDPWTRYRSHSESLDFLNHHPKMVECVQHIFEQDKAGKISKYVPAGIAAALLYLMGSCGTSDENVAAYRFNKPASEDNLTWRNWKKACMFWVDVAREAPELKTMRSAKRPIAGDSVDGDTVDYTGEVYNTATEKGDGGGTRDEKIATIVKAWNCYVADENLTPKRLAIEYTFETTSDGNSLEAARQTEFPSVGGIDFGGHYKPQKEETKEDPDATDDGVTDDEFAQGGGVNGEAPKGKGKGKGKGTNTAPTKTIADEFKELKEANPGKILVFKGVSDNYILYSDDAELVGPIVGSKVLMNPRSGMNQIVISPAQYEGDMAKVQAAGHSLALVEQMRDGKRPPVTDIPRMEVKPSTPPVKGGKAKK